VQLKIKLNPLEDWDMRGALDGWMMLRQHVVWLVRQRENAQDQDVELLKPKC
jgi:hypothetical protein